MTKRGPLHFDARAGISFQMIPFQIEKELNSIKNKKKELKEREEQMVKNRAELHHALSNIDVYSDE